MSLAATHATIRPTRPGGTCSFVALYARLDENDTTWLRDALDDEVGFTAAEIAETLRADGHDVARVTVARHRRKECRCESR